MNVRHFAKLIKKSTMNISFKNTPPEEWGEEIDREFGTDMDTLLYLKWITSMDLLYSPGNSPQCYTAAWMGGEFGGKMDTCICMTESLHFSPETITKL